MRLKGVAKYFNGYFGLVGKFGFVALIDNILNWGRRWRLKATKTDMALSQGSISGRDSAYINLVRLANSDDKIFKKFKANCEYQAILEHVSREDGLRYVESIYKYGDLHQQSFDFLRQDYCKPNRFSYPVLGRISSTNARYLKVALDLRALFGSLEGFKISEIGIGYGGQFHAISMISNPVCYTVFDLPEVVTLAKKYSDRFNPQSSLLEMGDYLDKGKQSDLVISNYAFSELDRSLQELYLKNVILAARRGYLIYNEINEEGIDTMTINEFVGRIPGATVLQEWPLTHPGNRLVVWGHEDTSKLLQL